MSVVNSPKDSNVTPATDAANDARNAPSTFSIFSAKANKQIQKDFISQQEHYRSHITELERIIHEHGLEVPEFTHDFRSNTGRERRLTCLMEDGSLHALSRSVERTAEHAHCYEIHVQYRNLTFWSMVPEKRIPTVGSALRGMVAGSGKKHRVNIINDLTGRILPKRMTLVMGPPGCGEYLGLLVNELCVLSVLSYR